MFSVAFAGVPEFVCTNNVRAVAVHSARKQQQCRVVDVCESMVMVHVQ